MFPFSLMYIDHTLGPVEPNGAEGWAVRVWQKLWQQQEDFVEEDMGVLRLIPDLWSDAKKPIVVREVYRQLADISAISTAGTESRFKSLIIWGQPGVGIRIWL